MSTHHDHCNAAFDRVLAMIEDDELDRRYPNGTHFIDARHPQHGRMTTSALLEGDPVTLIYPDGHELLLTPHPEHRVGSLAARLLRVFWLRDRATDIHMPPGTRIEARDASGLPLAA